ncbi:response regulator [Brevundimonas sp. LF-1]|uniref:response regulator n=1 Tax=Brevundimonas sp. LF-1 TaxID=3126100 RepID=UPI0030DF9861
MADDHPANRLVVQVMLEAMPVDLVSVENGAEALEAFRQGGFDLVLMDMQMPVMDGLTATAAIASTSGRRTRRARPC